MREENGSSRAEEGNCEELVEEAEEHRLSLPAREDEGYRPHSCVFEGQVSGVSRMFLNIRPRLKSFQGT